MYVGRYKLGDVVELPLVVRSSAAALTAPTAAPLAAVYDAAGARVADWQYAPPTDPGGAVGRFKLRLRLGSTFAVGHYTAVFQALRPSAGAAECWFEIVAGGDVDGAVVAAHFYPRPQADFLLLRLDSDKRLLCKEPRENL